MKPGSFPSLEKPEANPVHLGNQRSKGHARGQEETGRRTHITTSNTCAFLLCLPPTEEKYVTVQPYTSQSKDEIGFEKGVTVEVIRKNLEGWWYIR